MVFQVSDYSLKHVGNLLLYAPEKVDPEKRSALQQILFWRM